MKTAECRNFAAARRFAAVFLVMMLVGAAATWEGTRIVYETVPEGIDRAVDVLRARLVAPVNIHVADEGRIHVDLPPEARVEDVRARAEARGGIEFLLAAEQSDFGATEPKALEREFLRWMEEHPGSLPSDYPMPATEAGGPPNEIVFAFQYRRETPGNKRVVALVRSPQPEWRFTEKDLARCFATIDEFGYPAIGIELSKLASKNMGEFSAANLGRSLAIVLDGEVLSLAHFEEPLFAHFQIRRSRPPFSQEEVNRVVAVLSSGSLPGPLRFVEARRIP